jgi:ribose-phosphate pyrophosphokinase
VGGAERARAYAKRLDVTLALIDKRRPAPNVSEVMNVIGDIKDKNCVLVDDIIDTAGTLTSASDALFANGAKSVIACCTHAVLSGPALERLEKSSLEKLLVTNSIPLSEKAVSCNKIKSLSVAQLLAKGIMRIAKGESVSSLFV